MSDLSTLRDDVRRIRRALDGGGGVDPATLPPIVPAGSHWVSGTWTHPGQLGDADGTRKRMWQDAFTGTQKVIADLNALGLPVFFGGDLNTPKANLPKFMGEQVWVYNTAGYDKLLYVPAGPYQIRVDSTVAVPLNSDHDLHCATYTLLLDGVEVFTFRFGTANVNHAMPEAKKLADMQTVLALCDIVVWQETDTPAANALIDQVFVPAEWLHLFPDLEVDMSVRTSMFTLTPKRDWPAGLAHGVDSVKISDGVAHVSPNRYLGRAVLTPIPQPA